MNRWGSLSLSGRKPGPVVFRKRVCWQKGLHVWTFSHNSSKQEPLLNYFADPTIKIGDRIFILNKGRKLAASVVAMPAGEQFRYLFETDPSFPVAGMSGPPVYLPRPGAVIGAFQAANHRTKATIGGFELLQME